MNRHKGTGSDWVTSLVNELDLVEKDPVANLSRFRTLVEECHLPERIQQTVVTVNKEVGYQALHLLDFLPPHRSILHLSFCKKKTKYTMEIVLRTSGPAVVFHSVPRAIGAWNRYLFGCSRDSRSHIAFKQNFIPGEITDESIKVWFSFLLSGFDKKFDPGTCKQSPKILDFAVVGFHDKATA
jgi:hypothetical protein